MGVPLSRNSRNLYRGSFHAGRSLKASLRLACRGGSPGHYHLLDGHIFGFSLWEIAYTSAESVDEEVVARFIASVPWEDYPHLTEHRDQHMTDGAHREASAFEVGLDLILDGLQSRDG